MPVMCRRLQRLIKPMAVHLESQHRLNVVPGILDRTSFSGPQHVDFIKPAPQLPFELVTRKLRPMTVTGAMPGAAGGIARLRRYLRLRHRRMPWTLPA